MLGLGRHIGNIVINAVHACLGTVDIAELLAHVAHHITNGFRNMYGSIRRLLGIGGKFFRRCRHLFRSGGHLPDKPAQIIAHRIKSSRQRADFITGINRQFFLRQIAVGHFLGMSFHYYDRIGNHPRKAEAYAYNQNKTQEREYTINHLQAADRRKHIIIGNAHTDNPARAVHGGIGNNSLTIRCVCHEGAFAVFENFIKAAANPRQILHLAANLFVPAITQNNAVFIGYKGLACFIVIFNLLGHGIYDSQINIRAQGAEILTVLLEGSHCRYDKLAGVLVHIRLCKYQFARLLGIVIPRTSTRVERARALVLRAVGGKIAILCTDIEVKNFRVRGPQCQRGDGFYPCFIPIKLRHQVRCILC